MVEGDFEILRGDTGDRTTSRARTDGSGHFLCVLAGRGVPGEEIRVHSGESWSFQHLPDRIPASARIDLGDVLLQELPVLVAGELRHENGQPLQGARLTYRHWSAWSDDAGRFTLRAVTDEPLVEVGVERWFSLDPLRVAPGTLDAVFTVTKTAR